MTSGEISKSVVINRLDWIRRMLAEIRALPIGNSSAFFADSRNIWTAESRLRRCIEALFDLGRHILAKGHGFGVSEYKEIATQLGECGALSIPEVELLSMIAGYQNRLVHFYHEIAAEELFDICDARLSDLENLANSMYSWLHSHPEKLDESL